MRRKMTQALNGFRIGGAAAVLALAVAAAQGCGSPAGTEPLASKEAGLGDQDAGGDANVADGTTTGAADGGTNADGAAAEGAAPDVASPDAGAGCDPDASMDIDCTGLCGPVRNPCSGVTKMCGGCVPADVGDGGTEPRICDLTTNTCVKPKVTCAELGAQCGTVRDSCGDFLDCPDTSPKGCSQGQQCNTDTNQCEACEQVTCADLGYQCGFAWLGCGPDTDSNYTDCGGCPASADGGAQTCNQVFHNCEPSCTAPSAAVVCAAAKANNGVQCGFISNGCGGIADCDNVAGFGCPAGQSCGVRGIENHCDPFEAPEECVAVGRACGDITSLCTGQKVHCGDCATGQVCNSNGVCGPPCTAKTCSDFAQYQCGTFDDTCGGTVTCGMCAGGVCDQTSHTCCATKQCAVDYAGACGSGLPNGCGQSTEACPCATGVCTADGGAAPPAAPGARGACCSPHDATFYSKQNECGTNLPDGCDQTLNVSCAAGQECVANATGAPGPTPAAGVVGSCCTRTDSCNLASGTCGQVQDSCRTAGNTYGCDKCLTGTECKSNACCRPAPGCAGGGGEGAECNDTKQPVDPGCGSARSCACGGGRVCWCSGHLCGASDGAGACKSPLSCSSPAYAGKCGTGLDNGTGGTLGCGCPAGQVCSTAALGATGTCQCNNPTGQPYTCANVPRGPGQAGGNACGTFDNGCGGTLNCGCSGGQACDTAATPAVCCAPASCPTPALGSACGSVTNMCTTVSCGCPSGTGNENFQCVAGKCACVKDTCSGRTGAQPDLCGGTLQCGG